MSGRRYLAYVPVGDMPWDHWRARLSRAVGSSDGLSVQFDDTHCFVLAKTAAIKIGRHGAIIGDLVRASGTKLVDSLTASEIADILATRGQALIDHFWGSYIAILPSGTGSIVVIRAPMGDLACYLLDVAGGMMIASDIDLLVEHAAYRPAIDWTALTDHLLAADLRRSQTCLAGVREIIGSERLTVSAARVIEPLWTPWSFVQRCPAYDDPSRSPEQLRRTICRTVAARASGFERSILLLSGGLDSSIVAAALARWRCSTQALTMVARDRAGDERIYAGMTADHLAMPLRDIVRDIAQVDVRRSLAAGLPYPAERSFAQATRAAAIRLATATDAGAILNGGGGDHVFCSTQSVAPVTDLLLRRQLGRPLWQTANSVASLAQVTSALVVRKAIARLFRRGPAIRLQPTLDLLSNDARQRAAEAVNHPWFETPAGVLPGSAAHVANLVRALSIVHSPDARAPLPSIPVLLAQPIVEACLAIPSWSWLDHGHNRAFARHAFSDMLPEAVVWRRSKGALNGFMVEIYEQAREMLRPFLLDGMLVASGLIDRPALEAALGRTGPVKGDLYGRILEFADVEAWLRSW